MHTLRSTVQQNVDLLAKSLAELALGYKRKLSHKVIEHIFGCKKNPKLIALSNARTLIQD